jgi:hypothetical protein
VAATAGTNASPSGEASPLSAAEWNASFEVARHDIERGAFATAARRLRRLVDKAPDLVDASRSTELRSLALGALRDESASSDRPPTTTTPACFDVPPPASPPAQTTRWYGWQTLIADGAAIGTTFFAPVAGLALYLTGGPIAHVMNENFARAGASLGVRAGLPLGVGLVGALSGAALSAASRSHDTALGAAVGGIIGAGAGAIGAVIIDSAVIAKESMPAEPAKAALTTIRPSAAPRREGGFDIGIAGTW